MKKLSMILFVVLIFGCTSNIEDPITGKWLMIKVMQDGKDVTAEHNPHNERYLILKSDSLFESGGRPYGTNTGKYSYDSKNNKLILDSDLGPEDDSHWNVGISNDTMYWRGYGSQWADNFEIVQVRAEK